MTAAPATIPGSGGATLRLTTASPLRAPGAEWVPIGEAAILLNRSEGQLRRDCAGLEPRGLARKRRVPGKRNEVWCIHLSYDRRLIHEAPGGINDASTGDRRPIEQTPEETLRGATEERRREATLKAEAVKMFRAFRADPSKHSHRDLPALRVAVRERTGIMPSRRTLYLWDGQCPATTGDPSRDATLFAAALLDARAGRSGGGDGVTRAPPDAWAAFESLYLDPRQRTIAWCHRRVAALANDNGWGWPSERRVAQMVKERITPTRACLAREGEHAWKRKHEYSMEQDTEKWAPMQVWVGDHARMDFFVGVAVGGKQGGEIKPYRPWLSLWLDWRTRTVCGYHLTLRADSQSIKAALLDGVRRMGCSVPEMAWIDNGKDYASAALHGLSRRERSRLRDGARHLGGLFDWDKQQAIGVFGRLGIEPHFANPYNHNGKARVERFFRSMHEDFDRSIATYCGGDPGMVSEEHRVEAECKERPERLPTLDDVREKLDAWVAAYNATPRKGMADLTDPATGELLSPMGFLVRHPHHTRTVIDADAVALLEPRIGNTTYKVTKHGVTVTIGKQRVRYGAGHPALEGLKGSERGVWVSYDPADTSSIRVYDERMRFVCIAEANERFGAAVSAEAWERVGKVRKAQRAEAKRRPDRAERLMSDAELALKKQRDIEVEKQQAQIKRENPAIKAPPALRIVGTGLEGQREAIERAEMRVAAGAETMGRDDMVRVDLADLNRHIVTVHSKDEDTPYPDITSLAAHADDDREERFPSLVDLLR